MMTGTMVSRARRNRISARWYVVGIVALTLVPIIFITGWLATWLTQSERAQLEQGARRQTGEIVAAIEREVVGIQNVLTVLAGSPFLQPEGLEAFYNQAREVSQKLKLDFVVRDYRTERQVVNTALPWGTELTGSPAPRNETEDQMLRSGQPFVSNVFFGALIKQYVVAVIIPVPRGGELQYSVAVGVPLTRFAEILNTLNLSSDHLATVIDRNGHIITRSERHSEFAGTQVKVAWPPDTQKIGRSINRDGIPFHWFNQQSELAGWYFSVGMPDQVFDAPANRARATFALAGGLLLALAIMLSYRLGGQLAQSTGALGIDREPTREEFEVLFEAAPNGVMVISGSGIIMLVNKRIEQYFGYSQGELIGQLVEVLVPRRFRTTHLSFRAGFWDHPEGRPMGAGREVFGLRKDGSEFPVEIALNPISTGAENLVMATVVDVSERKRSERNLSAALKERDELRRRYIQAQESERLRLAHELHDQTGQALTGAMLELKGIEALAEEPQRNRMRSLRKQMEEMGKTLHRVAWELRPLSIDEVGLAGALSNYLSEWSNRYGIEADFYSRNAQLDDLPDETRTTIYRVVQEALTNVAKHAQEATEISVVIEASEHGLQLTIDDNGPGFDTSIFNGDGELSGLGLAGMRERISLIGGVIEIESVVGAGTTIFARIPCNKNRSLEC